uniref:NADH-ubiquinone oxidoreductase chain 4L n=1 Tax=Navis striatus TaxID=1580118 RepID=A0A1P8AG86_9ACAR|nr:NADH dehydrogenase subunit 4L [Navis striatus]AIZ58461.1 NADH dehydrogenase subunit 4L [Navis striatus]AIZ58474.1 NADH dehydrogenase subunit 4L [Navis striatus]AMX74128.1 NADH dehydrogenase subunit 4L [Navis striatus]QLD97033.1 NADH dehydrogenase subunit 4L [Navis striatus]QLD97046.1 NADH dehydrogenase subunit 4L [Navis striatus]
MIVLGLFFFSFGLLSLLINHKHFLMLLLCFELMYLGIFILLLQMTVLLSFFLNLILYLIIIVCEASLGVSILVASVYYYGNDKLGVFSLLKC